MWDMPNFSTEIRLNCRSVYFQYSFIRWTVYCMPSSQTASSSGSLYTRYLYYWLTLFFVSLIIGTIVFGLESTWFSGKTRQGSSQAQVEWFSRTTSAAAQGLHLLFMANTCLRLLHSLFPPMLAIFMTESNTHEGFFYSVTWSYLCWLAWLVFQGVTNTATSEPSLHLLSKLTVFSNVSLVDPSQAAGECSCWCVIFSEDIWKEGELYIWVIDQAWG